MRFAKANRGPRSTSGSGGPSIAKGILRICAVLFRMPMDAMATLRGFLPYVTMVTAITGIVFGVVSIMQWRRSRYMTAAVELVHSMLSADFARSIQRVIALPVGAPPERVLEDAETHASAYVVSHVFESLGVLVFYGILPLHLVDHLVGGYVRGSWERLRPYTLDRRKILGPTVSEWHQWLVEQMLADPVPGKAHGAPVVHRQWRRRGV